MSELTKKRLSFIIHLVFWGIIITLAYLGLRYLFGAILPFLIATGIAALLQRPINFLDKKTKLKRKFWSPVFVTVTFLIMAFLIFVLGAQLIGQLVSFINQVPGFVSDLTPKVSASVSGLLEGLKESLPDEFASMIESTSASLTSQAVSVATSMAGSLAASIASFTTTRLPFIIISFIITIVATFFISSGYDGFMGFIKRQIPNRVKKESSGLKKFSKSVVLNMLKSYLTIMLITFAELSIGLSIIIGMEYSILLAAIIAVLDILPILGSGTVLIPWAIISLLLGNWGMALGLIILYAVITIIRNIIEPRIVGINLGLHPIVTLISMYLGLQVMGVSGMFLFPLTCLLLITLQENGSIKIWK